jgi:hypothetical protein
MSHKTKPCPRCGGNAWAANPSRETFEHRTAHLAAHAFKHRPILGSLGLAAVALSKLLPRQYRCARGHTFSA